MKNSAGKLLLFFRNFPEGCKSISRDVLGPILVKSNEDLLNLYLTKENTAGFMAYDC